MNRIFGYGMFLFLFGCVPMFSEGVKVLEFANMDDTTLNTLCEFNVE